MPVSIVICTWNRAALLDQTLAKMARLDVPPKEEWELLVVDNNSTDDTPAVLEKHRGRLPLRALFEPRAGKPYAANLALAEAAHDLTLWTDDDVLVHPSWVASYVQAAREFPEATYFGGVIEPLFSHDPPRWLAENLDELRAPFAMLDLGPRSRRLASNELPFGANMALVRSRLGKVRFDPRLGPSKDNQIRGEESQLVEQLLATGAHGAWVPDARVRHYLPPQRLTLNYLRDYYRGYGRTEARRAGSYPGRRVAGAPLWAVREHWQSRVAAALHAPRKGTRWVRAFRRAMITRGIIEECRAAARVERPTPPGAAGEAAIC